jgi:hypothetical protein
MPTYCDGIAVSAIMSSATSSMRDAKLNFGVLRSTALRYRTLDDNNDHWQNHQQDSALDWLRHQNADPPVE